MTALFIALLAIAAFVDLIRREIPDTVCLCIGLLALFDPNPLGILAAVPFFGAALINPEGIGGGDVKLTAAVGLYLGFEKTVFGVCIGLFLALLVGFVMARIQKKPLSQTVIPLAPFLAAGWLFTL